MHNINQPPPYIKDLIIKFLEKEASPTEIEILEDWLKQDDLHRKQFDEINDTFQAALTLGRFAHQKTDNAWEKLSARLKQERTERNPVRNFPEYRVLKIAASVLIVLAAGIGAWKLLVPRSENTKNLSVVQ